MTEQTCETCAHRIEQPSYMADTCKMTGLPINNRKDWCLGYAERTTKNV